MIHIHKIAYTQRALLQFTAQVESPECDIGDAEALEAGDEPESLEEDLGGGDGYLFLVKKDACGMDKLAGIGKDGRFEGCRDSVCT